MAMSRQQNAIRYKRFLSPRVYTQRANGFRKNTWDKCVYWLGKAHQKEQKARAPVELSAHVARAGEAGWEAHLGKARRRQLRQVLIALREITDLCS